jgi:excisionase family DNA binding protein
MTTADDESDVLPAPLLLTVREAARLLAVGRTSVYQLVWDGEITPVRIGRSVRFTLAELERFVNERAPASPPDAQAIV